MLLKQWFHNSWNTETGIRHRIGGCDGQIARQHLRRRETAASRGRDAAGVMRWQETKL